MMDLLNCYSVQLKPRLQVPSSLSGSGFFNLNTFMMEKEIWKDVKGYEGLYQVSNKGRVKGLERTVQYPYHKRNLPEKLLSATLNTCGYPHVILSKKGKRKCITVHRLVAFHFIPNPENKPFINHIDGNKENPLYSNLEWCTSSENQIHSYEIGLQSPIRGESCINSKLTEQDVMDIKNTYEKDPNKSQRDLAKEYNVSQRLIWNVLNDKAWAHV